MSAAHSQMKKYTAADMFRAAMRNTANCVAIVASQGVAGRAGITVSSMVPVSAEPPMLLVCINRNSLAHDVIFANGRFSVNVLGIEQRQLADRFAGRGERPYQFESRAWTFAPFPELKEFAARYDCELSDARRAGTHTILIGRVQLSVPGELAPLCYFDRQYVRAATMDAVSTDFVLEGKQPRHKLAALESRLETMS